MTLTWIVTFTDGATKNWKIVKSRFYSRAVKQCVPNKVAWVYKLTPDTFFFVSIHTLETH